MLQSAVVDLLPSPDETWKENAKSSRLAAVKRTLRDDHKRTVISIRYYRIKNDALEFFNQDWKNKLTALFLRECAYVCHECRVCVYE